MINPKKTKIKKDSLFQMILEDILFYYNYMDDDFACLSVLKVLKKLQLSNLSLISFLNSLRSLDDAGYIEETQVVTIIVNLTSSLIDKSGFSFDTYEQNMILTYESQLSLWTDLLQDDLRAQVAKNIKYEGENYDGCYIRECH